MQNDFYTSTEVSTITGCSRRQLQYWRDKGVVVPTVNPSGKGRNIYYSVKELLALTLMHRLLSLGLSFEPSVKVLEMLKHGETWLFGESLEPSQSKRWMIALGIKDYSPAVLNFDRDFALEMLERGGGIFDLASDSIYQHLKRNLAEFKGEVIPSSDEYLLAGGSESVVFENVRIAPKELLRLDNGKAE
jgi:DNA-binding transcriptional MerR regulator